MPPRPPLLQPFSQLHLDLPSPFPEQFLCRSFLCAAVSFWYLSGVWYLKCTPDDPIPILGSSSRLSPSTSKISAPPRFTPAVFLLTTGSLGRRCAAAASKSSRLPLHPRLPLPSPSVLGETRRASRSCLIGSMHACIRSEADGRRAYCMPS